MQWPKILQMRRKGKQPIKKQVYLYVKQSYFRIGGDWAVASVLLSRDVRDQLRKILGPDLTIVNLTMSNAGEQPLTDNIISHDLL